VLDNLLERVSQAIVAEQRLTSELAHELRTPLTVIRAEAELGTGDPGSRARFLRIIQSVDLLTGAIDTLLALARGQVGQDARAVVDEVLARAAVTATAADREIVIDPAPGLEVAVPDEFAWRALAPLVDNALRYSVERVRLHAEPSGSAVEISVVDDGRGVGVESPEELFAPGFRESESTGAGLGLPLARRLARAAGGEVLLRTAHPTTFVLTLPRATARARQPLEAGRR
jgi:signal transduction histidine kinase